jgi:hypothetical protein
MEIAQELPAQLLIRPRPGKGATPGAVAAV